MLLKKSNLKTRSFFFPITIDSNFFSLIEKQLQVFKMAKFEFKVTHSKNSVVIFDYVVVKYAPCTWLSGSYFDPKSQVIRCIVDYYMVTNDHAVFRVQYAMTYGQNAPSCDPLKVRSKSVFK